MEQAKDNMQAGKQCQAELTRDNATTKVLTNVRGGCKGLDSIRVLQLAASGRESGTTNRQGAVSPAIGLAEEVGVAAVGCNSGGPHVSMAGLAAVSCAADDVVGTVDEHIALQKHPSGVTPSESKLLWHHVPSDQLHTTDLSHGLSACHICQVPCKGLPGW